jgi:SAM-dependent MidA family methyltransferase
MNQLIKLLRCEMQQNNGAISFARFMEFVLYTPELGYYAAGPSPFGKKGDFFTAPEISSLFSQCLANQCKQIITELPQSDIVEIGAGSGVMARDVLLKLEQLDSLPERYLIFEPCAGRREQQKVLFAASCSPGLQNRIHWLDTLPVNIQGIIIANEVMDALPVHCFEIDETGAKERCVTWDNGQFAWHLMEPAQPELREHLKTLLDHYPLPAGYQSEISLTLSGWVSSAVKALKQGVILLFDYGYGRAEYYHPERSMGTLMCYHQHQRHDDPFQLPGSQDITAHVDFTRVIESASAAGCSLAGYTTQVSFLLACSLLELAAAPDDTIAHFEKAQAVKTLTLPSQMGESIKIMGLSKNFPVPLLGFSLHNRIRNL